MSWLNGATVTTAEDKVDQEKKRQRNAVINEFNEIAGSVSAQYPEREKETFFKQLEEAKAYTADPNAVTPFIDAMIARTGDTKADRVDWILQKDAQYSEAMGDAVGELKVRLAELDQ